HAADARELLAPVTQLLFELCALQPLTLPHSKVAILDRELSQIRFAPFAEAFLELGDLTDDYADGPCIADDVVQRQQQHVLLTTEPQQSHAQQWSGLQIEAALSFGGCETRDFLRLSLRIVLFEIEQRNV